MSRRSGVLVLLLLLVLPSLAAAQATAVHSDRREVALVVGNSAYAAAPLANPVNDARAVDTALRELGFETVFVTDATRSGFEAAIARFAALLSDAEVVLVYYAGHGLQVNGENFAVPVDTEPDNPAPLVERAVSVSGLLATIERLAPPTAAKILLLDACRNNPFVDGPHAPGERVGRGLARIAPPPVSDGPAGATGADGGYFRVIAFATAPDETAADGDGAHSPYTASLVRHLREPGLEAGELFRRVAADVQAETGGRQKPEYLVQTSRQLFFKAPYVTDCDRAAIEDQNFVGLPGIPFDDIDAARAIPACEAATAAQPDSARLKHNYARALEKGERLEAALAGYQAAAEAGYPPAINALGIMYLSGCGLPGPDIARGLDLVARARELGNLSARASLTAHDILRAVPADGVERLRTALAAKGFDAGSGDAASEALKAAIAAFQRDNGLSERGLTLETIRALGLADIVPHRFRCH